VNINEAEGVDETEEHHACVRDFPTPHFARLSQNCNSWESRSSRSNSLKASSNRERHESVAKNGVRCTQFAAALM
jgi:hypothetical protein